MELFLFSTTEYQKENVWLYRSLFGRCKVDFTQLYHIQRRYVYKIKIDY